MVAAVLSGSVERGTVPRVEEPRHLKASEVKIGSMLGLWNGRQVQPAEVIEDRGNVGRGGRHIFRVRVASSGDDGLEFDAPLDSLVELVPRRPRKGTSRASSPKTRRVKAG
jgi:hypothetical protein